MKETKQAIEDAIEGGWNELQNTQFLEFIGDGKTIRAVTGDNVFLDPTFWQALGRTRGWDGAKVLSDNRIPTYNTYGQHWHQFIDHLADGKSIEESLLAISE